MSLAERLIGFLGCFLQGVLRRNTSSTSSRSLLKPCRGPLVSEAGDLGVHGSLFISSAVFAIIRGTAHSFLNCSISGKFDRV